MNPTEFASCTPFLSCLNSLYIFSSLIFGTFLSLICSTAIFQPQHMNWCITRCLSYSFLELQEDSQVLTFNNNPSMERVLLPTFYCTLDATVCGSVFSKLADRQQMIWFDCGEHAQHTLERWGWPSSQELLAKLLSPGTDWLVAPEKVGWASGRKRQSSMLLCLLIRLPFLWMTSLSLAQEYSKPAGSGWSLQGFASSSPSPSTRLISHTRTHLLSTMCCHLCAGHW